MYDSATGKYSAPHFHNYVTGKVDTYAAHCERGGGRGHARPAAGWPQLCSVRAQGLALQKTQIGRNARLAGPGAHDVSYHRYGSHLKQPDSDESAVESSFFDGIDTSLPGIASLAPEAADKFRPALQRIDQQIAEAQGLFDAATPQRTAPPLRLALASLDQFLRGLANPAINDLSTTDSFNLLHELRIKRVQLQRCAPPGRRRHPRCGLHPHRRTQRLAHDSPAHRRQRDPQDGRCSRYPKRGNEVSRRIQSRHGPHLRRRRLRGGPSAASRSRELAATGPSRARRSQAPPTRPNFSRPNIEQPFYDIADPALRNAPMTPAPLTVSAVVIDHGIPLDLVSAVADPNASGPRQAIVVVPPVSVTLPVHAAVIPVQRPTFTISYSSFNPEPAFAPQFRLELPPLWTYTVPGTDNPLPEPLPAGRISRQTAFVTTADPNPYRAYPVTVVTEIHGHEYREGYRSVGYPGLATTNFYTPTVFHATTVDLTVPPGLNIAYLPGTGDEVPAALEDLGVRTHIILPSDLTLDILRYFDAVVLGVRAYEAQPELASANSALNAYAAGGGVVIAQYNTGRLPENTGPFPLSLGSNEKVVEENARVRILAPAAPILTWPNQITPADFENWIEERGHGFMSTWDARYQALLETHDTGQQPQRGGLLVARTGRGAWIYLGLALYRQLPEGVPGPYRISSPTSSARARTQASSQCTQPPHPRLRGCHSERSEESPHWHSAVAV